MPYMTPVWDKLYIMQTTEACGSLSGGVSTFMRISLGVLEGAGF